MRRNGRNIAPEVANGSTGSSTPTRKVLAKAEYSESLGRLARPAGEPNSVSYDVVVVPMRR